MEIKPKSDTCAQRFPGTGYDYTYIDVKVDDVSLSWDGYYYLNGGSEYPIKLKLFHDYRDPETLELIHEEFDFPESQLFSAYIRVYENNVEGTAVISGVDTCMYLSGIQQGFRLLAGNGLDKDTCKCYLEIETVSGARYNGSAGIRILKSQLFFTFQPEVVRSGDTVNILIKRKNINGTFTEFSPEQPFEAGILEGCDYGKFIWAGLKETVHVKKTVYTNDSVYVIDSVYIKDKDSVYVKDVKQPIIFVAADSFDTETPSVKMRIGVKGNECYEMGSLTKSRFKEKRTIGSNSCALIDFMYPDYTTLDKTILKKDCRNWAYQNNNYIEPTFEIITLPNGTDGVDACKDVFGRFYPLYDSLFDFKIQPCYNTSSHRWNFKIQDNIILIRTIMTICESNFSYPNSYWIPINNINELLSPPSGKITQDKVEDALKDFEMQKIYNNCASNRDQFYLITKWLSEHESWHRKDYEEVADRVYNLSSNRIKERIKNMWEPSCDDFYNLFCESLERLKQQGNKQLLGILKGKDKSDQTSFQFKLTDEFEKCCDKSYTIRWYDGRYAIVDYEQYTLSRVWKIIDDYIAELLKRRNK